MTAIDLDPVEPLDVIAALTENDVESMVGSGVGRIVDLLTDRQRRTIVMCLAGADPRLFARLVREYGPTGPHT